ncbi:MAG: sigma-70 family RNA polymerase sigma factor [Candidatus Kapaibacterium sp.]
MSDKRVKEISSSQSEDLETINRISSGDVNAFGILQNKYKRVVASLIRKMIKDEDDIDDLVQETFIKAYNALDKYKSEYTFSAWIYRIASNSCIDFLRKKRLNVVSIDKPISVNSDDDDNLYIEIEDFSNRPDVELLNRERYSALQNAIDSLPEKYKLIIKLRHEEELDYNEISKRLEMPLGTVKAHLFRARKLLLDELKQVKFLFSE